MPRSDMSQYLVHWVGRRGAKASEVPDEIVRMAARDRLEWILREARILAFPTFYSSDVPVVCFTEASSSVADEVVASGTYEPWGLVFSKATVWAAGGGPVGYVRADEWAEIRSLPSSVRARFVRYALGEEDWTHEREWRIPITAGSAPAFTFDRGSIYAVLVGSPAWQASEPQQRINPRTGDIEWEQAPAPWGQGLPVRFWNGSTFVPR